MTLAPTVKNFLTVAASKIGYREGRDANGNWNNDNMFGIWYGWNRVAWCAQFVSWCANEVGALGTIVPKYQSTFAGLTWFRKRDQSGYWPPQAGDIFMMCEYNPGSTYDTGNGWATIHTGIVEKYLGDGRVQTIEGNTNDGGSAQGNGVYRLIRQDSESGKRFIYARPKWEADSVQAPTTPTPTQQEEDDMQLTDQITLVKRDDVAYASPTTDVQGVLASTNYYVLQTRNLVNAQSAQITALMAAVQTLATVRGLDPEAMKDAVNVAVREALDNLRIVDVDPV